MSRVQSPTSTWIDEWNPDDAVFWQRTGRTVARRNLLWSIVAESLGFSVWMIWSVVAARLPAAGFHYTTDQLFQLVAVPGLVGALMRFPYTFAVPRFGGRNWTIVSALLLLIPAVGLSYFVTRPDTPFSILLIVAATAGFGGGNFASSMANISFFYPDKEKGFALALNAAGGNVGVSLVQLVVPFVIGWGWVNLYLGAPQGGSGLFLQNAGLLWIPLILVAAWGASRYMSNLSSARSNFRDQLSVTSNVNTWLVSWLYIGTFGSFIGFSAALPLLMKTQFPEVTLDLAFLGPMVGSVARPVGGYLSDRFGGPKVTLWAFVVMTVATLSVVGAIAAGSFAGVMAAFFVLFITTGIGNGSTFRIVPSVFQAERLRRVEQASPDAKLAALTLARRDTAAVLGLSSAIGACGGYLIPRTFGYSIQATGGPSAALLSFVVFYVTCIVITIACYTSRERAASSASLVGAVPPGASND